MTPVHLNSPSSPFQPTDQKDEQRLHLYFHPSYAASSSLPCPTQEQRMVKLEDQKDEQYCLAHVGSRDDLQMFSSSFPNQPTTNNKTSEAGEGSTSENGSSSKWISTKMGLMQKMMNSNCTGTHETSVKIKQKLHDNNEVGSFNNSNNTVRVCADCNTTTTPLWRSGPRGPKSLCNACGIRQRKARRTMEAAAAAGNGTIAATDNPSTKIMLHCKEKKWSANHVAQYKSSDPFHRRRQRKLFFKDFALSWSKNSALKQVFPQDVEEAAILLMELSCGVIHS